MIRMSSRSKKWLRGTARWGIAIVGAWYVLANISCYDRVLVPGPGGWPLAMRLAEPTPEKAIEFKVKQGDGSIKIYRRDELFARTDFARIIAREDRPDVHY